MTRGEATAKHVLSVSVECTDDYGLSEYTATVTRDGRTWSAYAETSRAAIRYALRAMRKQLRHERRKHTAVSA